MRNLLVIYENSDWRNYGSLADLRPIFCLRTGMTALWQSLKRSFPGFDLQFICRSELEFVALRETGIAPKPISGEAYQRIVFIDTATRPDTDFVRELQQAEGSRFFRAGERVAAVALADSQIDRAAEVARALSAPLGTVAADLESMGVESAPVEVRRYNYIWDLMLASAANIGRDFEIALRELGALSEHNLAKSLDGSQIIGEGQAFVHPGATVQPGVVIDTTSGPVYIDEGSLVEPGSYIVGPFYAGVNCKLMGGKLSGSALGPFCQVAGELEDSLLQGYVNKHHAGFIGHSYVGEWVNFGALTTNSDLKNNYSPVSVAVHDDLLNTGSNKVGSFIGDHTKFGIGTLLNTGVNIGVFCNIFGGTLIVDKSVPSFSWGASGSWQRHDIEKALQTAGRAMARRGSALTNEDMALIRSLAERQAEAG